MPQPAATAKATAAAAASPNPGTGAPVLAAWLLVRRRNVLISFAKRRYVVLTDDHVLRVDSTPVLHLVDCRITTHASSKLIDLTPAPSAGLPVRIFTDSPFQYSKWRLALQATADASIHRFYRIDMDHFVGVGVHGIVRSAMPCVPATREHSIESSNPPSDFTHGFNEHDNDFLHRYLSRGLNRSRPRGRPSANRGSLQQQSPHQRSMVGGTMSSGTGGHSTHSEFDAHSMAPNRTHDEDPLMNDLHNYSDSDTRHQRSSDVNAREITRFGRNRSREYPRRMFKRRILSMAGDRNSVDLDPDERVPDVNGRETSIPSSKHDKRFLRQPSHLHTVASTTASQSDVGHDAASATSAVPSVASTAVVQAVAVKTISRAGSGAVTVASELLFSLARLNHFAIVKVLDVFLAVSEIHVVMEYCSGGTLAQYVASNGPLSETDCKLVFAPILKAVGYLHASGVVHWDVTPANVLFVGDAPPFEPKLIDFGTARPIDPANGRVPTQHEVFLEKGKVASLACASPELLTSKAHRYAAKADMWQLGCLLYFLLYGDLPFSKKNGVNSSIASTILGFCKKRSPERRRFLFGMEAGADSHGVSEDAKLLIMKLLCPNPRMRPNALHCLKEFAFLSPVKS